ncbi:MAG TPA: methyltransferase domain-containing protein [Ktedonobacterales bacterium]
MSWLAFWRRDRATAARQAQPAGLRIFGGRRFVRGVPYILPSDGEELNRLDFQHYMLRYALRGNFAAPLRQPHEILDVACGTGRWATEMATLFPQTNVVGFDLTPPPVESGATRTRPDNFAFIQGNMLEGLPFPDNSFDFVHQRLVIVALPTSQWVRQAQELLRVTRPGGWVELVEGDLLPGGPGATTLNGLGEQMSQKRGMSFGNAQRVGDYLRQAGARQVHQQVVHLPVGQRAGRLGAMAEADYLAIYASVRAFLIGQGLISEEQYASSLAQAQAELASGTLTWPFYIAYGQK